MEGDVNGVECRYAKATHNFVATKTDELNLTRNDILIITQAMDGGWWEGTNADGKTGWFPSNYVEELDKSQAAALRVAQQRRVSVAHYRVTILQTVVDTERAYYSELRRLCDVLLRPLTNSSLAGTVEVQRAVQCVASLAALHSSMLNALSECARTSAFKQRVGGLFLKLAPDLKRTYEAYFSAHPSLAHLVATRRSEIDNCFAAMPRGGEYSSPNTNDLIISLSAPFNRLEKYSALLKEIERHTDEAHLDRGDTQRAVVVLRDVFTNCVDLRKRKERELDILEGASISGIDTNELRRLGEVFYSGTCRVVLCAETERVVDGAYLVLFNAWILVLSTNVDLSGYRFEDRFSTQSCTVRQLDSVGVTPVNAVAGQAGAKSYSIEFTDCTSSRRFIAVLRTNSECTRWLEVLRSCTATTRSNAQTRPTPPNSLAQGAVPSTARLSNSVPGSPQSSEVLPPASSSKLADTVDNQQPASSVTSSANHGLKRASTVGGSLKNGSNVDHSQPAPRGGGLLQFRSAAPLRPFGNADEMVGDALSNSGTGSSTQTGSLASSVASPNVTGGLASLVSRSSAAKPHSKDDSFIRSPKPNRKMTRKQSQKVTPEDLYGKQADPQTVAEDYRILEVVDAYCVSHLRNRHTLQQPRARSVAPDDLRVHVAALSAATNPNSKTQTSGYLDILTSGGNAFRKLPPRSPPRSAFENVTVAPSRQSKVGAGGFQFQSTAKDIADEKQQLLLSLLPKVGSANLANRENSHVHAYACCPVCTAPPVQHAAIHAAHCPAANAGGQHDAAVYAVPYRSIQQGNLTPQQHTLLQSALNPHGQAKLSSVPQQEPVRTQPPSVDSAYSTVAVKAPLRVESADFEGDYERVVCASENNSDAVMTLQRLHIRNNSNRSHDTRPGEVRQLKNEVATLQSELMQLKTELKEEREWRKQLVQFVSTPLGHANATNSTDQHRSSLQGSYDSYACTSPIYSTVNKGAHQLVGVNPLMRLLSSASNSTYVNTQVDTSDAARRYANVVVAPTNHRPIIREPRRG